MQMQIQDCNAMSGRPFNLPLNSATTRHSWCRDNDSDVTDPPCWAAMERSPEQGRRQHTAKAIVDKVKLSRTSCSTSTPTQDLQAFARALAAGQDADRTPQAPKPFHPPQRHRGLARRPSCRQCARARLLQHRPCWPRPLAPEAPLRRFPPPPSYRPLAHPGTTLALQRRHRHIRRRRRDPRAWRDEGRRPSMDTRPRSAANRHRRHRRANRSHRCGCTRGGPSRRPANGRRAACQPSAPPTQPHCADRLRMGPTKADGPLSRLDLSPVDVPGKAVVAFTPSPT